MARDVVVLAYNFPHRKTQDFLFRLHVEGFRVAGVVAADAVELGIPPAAVRTKVRHGGLVHPKAVAARLGMPYGVAAHDGDEAARLLKASGAEVGVIAGARILPKRIIDLVPKGIVNFHPGLIPEARGLDAMLWSVRAGLPLGVTAHLVDERVDAGRVLVRHRIPVHPDDTAFDLSERLYETQLDLLRPAVEAALDGKGETVPKGSSYNRKMPPEMERETVAMVPEYCRSHAWKG
ncbi:MAG TPA: formyltransferase family protein [Candidatus Thermoplasmatota archaeon]|nr:formyltransferase family protein [Candidatus Thermoplasmatota archaeon]